MVRPLVPPTSSASKGMFSFLRVSLATAEFLRPMLSVSDEMKENIWAPPAILAFRSGLRAPISTSSSTMSMIAESAYLEALVLSLPSSYLGSMACMSPPICVDRSKMAMPTQDPSPRHTSFSGACTT